MEKPSWPPLRKMAEVPKTSYVSPIVDNNTLQARDPIRKLVVKGEPDWALLDVPHAKTLPAVRWKLENLSRMDVQQRAQAIARLEAVLARKA